MKVYYLKKLTRFSIRWRRLWRESLITRIENDDDGFKAVFIFLTGW